MAEQNEELQPEEAEVAAPEVTPPAEEPKAPEAEAAVAEVPAEEVTAPEAEPAKPEFELPENWEDSPLFRELKSHFDSRNQSAIDAAIRTNNERWQAYNEPLQKEVETLRTEGMDDAQRADYYKQQFETSRDLVSSWQSLQASAADISQEYGIPMERLDLSGGEAGMMKTAIAYIREEALKAAASPPASEAAPTAPATEAITPPKVVTQTERPSKPPAKIDEWKALSAAEQLAIERSDQKFREFWGPDIGE